MGVETFSSSSGVGSDFALQRRPIVNGCGNLRPVEGLLWRDRIASKETHSKWVWKPRMVNALANKVKLQRRPIVNGCGNDHPAIHSKVAGFCASKETHSKWVWKQKAVSRRAPPYGCFKGDP